MAGRYFIIVLLLFVIFVSCDPAIAVVIRNNSATDRNIRVFYPADFKLPLNTKDGTSDSLLVYDHTMTEHAISIRDYYRYPARIPVLLLDTVSRSYSFHLKARHEVIVESRFPAAAPTYGQVFIIGGADTIDLKRHGKRFKKAPKLLAGGSWTYTINDSIQP